MDHPKKSAGRRMMEAQDRRLAQVEEARQLATHLRDKVGVGAEAEAGAEEPGSLATAVAWVAAELRAGRIEHHDREALQQETGNRLRRRASDAHTV